MASERILIVDDEDGMRRLLEIERPATGELTTRSFGGLRPIRVVKPHGAATRFVWQDDDLVTRVEPHGNVVTTSYAPQGVNRDAPLGRPLLLQSDLVGVLEERGYDAAGRLVSVRNGAGETTLYGYGTNELVETVTTLMPMYWVRAVGGTLYLGGAVLCLVNLVMTWKGAPIRLSSSQYR